MMNKSSINNANNKNDNLINSTDSTDLTGSANLADSNNVINMGDNLSLGKIIGRIEENPVIAAIRRDEDIEYALESTVTTIFLLKEDIFTIEKNVQKIKDKNKSVFVHIELLEGLGKDNRAIDYLADVIKPNGIITTRTSQVKYAREKGIYTIQRCFLVDSQSYEIAIKSVQSVKPDMVEIMPAVMPGIISRFSKEVSLPVIAGGLIDSKNDIIEVLKAGALGASTGKKELWSC